MGDAADILIFSEVSYRATASYLLFHGIVYRFQEILEDVVYAGTMSRACSSKMTRDTDVNGGQKANLLQFTAILWDVDGWVLILRRFPNICCSTLAVS